MIATIRDAEQQINILEREISSLKIRLRQISDLVDKLANKDSAVIINNGSIDSLLTSDGTEVMHRLKHIYEYIKANKLVADTFDATTVNATTVNSTNINNSNKITTKDLEATNLIKTKDLTATGKVTTYDLQVNGTSTQNIINSNTIYNAGSIDTVNLNASNQVNTYDLIASNSITTFNLIVNSLITALNLSITNTATIATLNSTNINNSGDIRNTNNVITNNVRTTGLQVGVALGSDGYYILYGGPSTYITCGAKNVAGNWIATVTGNATMLVMDATGKFVFMRATGITVGGAVSWAFVQSIPP